MEVYSWFQKQTINKAHQLYYQHQHQRKCAWKYLFWLVLRPFSSIILPSPSFWHLLHCLSFEALLFSQVFLFLLYCLLMPNKMGFSVIRSIHSHTPLFQGFCMIEMLVSGWKFAHFYDVQTMKCLSFLFQFLLVLTLSDILILFEFCLQKSQASFLSLIPRFSSEKTYLPSTWSQ